MAEGLDRRIFEHKIKLPEMPGLDARSFREFLNWRSQISIAALPYDQFKFGAVQVVEIPEKLTEPFQKELTLGEVVMSATFTPQIEKPEYKAVLDDFESYLGFLKQNFHKGLKQKGVRTLGKNPYVSAGLVLEKLGEIMAEIAPTKQALNKSLYFIAPHDLAYVAPQDIIVVHGRNYSAFTESNARAAAESWNFIKEGNARAKEFKKRLKDDSFARLRGPPDETAELPYPFAALDYTFRHILIPERTPQNKPLIDALLNPAPEKITKASNIGEYVMLNMWKEAAPLLNEKGLVSEEFRKAYDPVVVSGKTFVKLDGLVERLASLRGTFINKTFNQRVYVLFND